MRTARRETRWAGSRSTGSRSTGTSAGSTAPRCHTIPTDAARHTVGAVSALVMVEGLPGSGKSTTAHALAAWLADRQVAAEHWAEGRTDHPVDFEQVAVLSREDLLRDRGRVARGFAGAPPRGRAARGRVGGARAAARGPPARIWSSDSDCTTPTTVTSPPSSTRGCSPRAGVGSADAAADGRPGVGVRAAPEPGLRPRRARRPAGRRRSRATSAGLVDAVRSHAPALVYLDAGDPRPVLERAAAERPSEWLELVVAYHTGQGLGLRCGLSGFEGYVEFMRRRREMELEVIDALDLPMIVVPVGDGRWDEHTAVIRAFVAEHLGLDRGARPSGPSRTAAGRLSMPLHSVEGVLDADHRHAGAARVGGARRRGSAQPGRAPGDDERAAPDAVGRRRASPTSSRRGSSTRSAGMRPVPVRLGALARHGFAALRARPARRAHRRAAGAPRRPSPARWSAAPDVPERVRPGRWTPHVTLARGLGVEPGR